VELVDPPAGARPGDRVFVDGFDGAPDAVLNPRQKVFEAVKGELATDGDGVACYRGAPLLTAAGPCRARSIRHGTVG
jgi:hypothetical protein